MAAVIDVAEGFGETERDRWEEGRERGVGRGQTEQAFKPLMARVFGDVFWIGLVLSYNQYLSI